MNHKLPRPAIAGIVLLLALVAYFGFQTFAGAGNGRLVASGTIEAVTVNVAPEISGKVTEVLTDEGQTVKTGDPLLRLDSSLLAAQRAVAAAQVDSAKAALASAQSGYDLALQNALNAEQASTAKTWRFSAPDEFNQPAWYFEASAQIQAAQAEVEAAQKGLTDVQANLEKVITDLNNANFVSAEKRLRDARAAFLVAKDVKTAADNAVEGGGLQKAADESYNTALDELRAAQNDYNALLNSKSAADVENARGQVIVAQQRIDAANTRLLALQTGAQSPAVVTASKALDQARTALAQSDSNLALLDAQLSKLAISSPADGTILTRNVEPGEFVQPGAVVLTLANLNQLTITVYVPENLYGQISLGQKARVTVDSFLALSFDATVVHISDQGEFTPRNVQTVQGRSGVMYAIKLQVDDPQGKLKPGMPADVNFSGQ
ncbi:MAG: efflux RND transporter periplasmic adaptor subunit [Chloroflexi bacterium]|nr:efflux RND transporter periplasmic adaptor subunit [Chloroflexota bacterium]MBI3341277.1 efflux RND transporter periplasmic adaptor subunit [Chloroflexota bacterium]